MHLVFIHGRAAAGKLTTARGLADRVGYPVFHNHLVVDTLTTVFQFGSEPFVRLREQFWLAVFSEAAGADRSIIFTFAPDPTVAAGFPRRARDAVEAHGGRICFVRLTVSDPEQERRIVDPSRAEFQKLNNLELLRRPSRGDQAEEPPVDLVIDTDAHRPEESAAIIAAHFSLPSQPSLPRYPV